jgi:hypothetical protein
MEGYISEENLRRKLIWSKSTAHIVPQTCISCHEELHRATMTLYKASCHNGGG